MIALTIKSNLGEANYGLFSPYPMEPDEYLIWHMTEMAPVAITSLYRAKMNNARGTFGATDVTLERVQRIIADRHKVRISHHIFATTSHSNSYESIEYDDEDE